MKFNRALFPTILWVLVFGVIVSESNAFSVSPRPGGIVLVRLTGKDIPQPEAWFGDRRVMVLSRLGTWYALIGINLSAVPGKYIVRFTEKSRRSVLTNFQIQPRLQSADEVIQRETTIAGVAVLDDNAVLEAVLDWRPLDSPPETLVLPPHIVSGNDFGHMIPGATGQIVIKQGVTLTSGNGAPLNAPADGKIKRVFKQSNGRFAVLIDHGQSLMSLFTQINAVIVDEDQAITQGESFAQFPGESDDKIEWRVYLNGYAVDPALFVD